MQPTLYEGGPGGGATFEAIGMGTPAVVSDIPVNREIDQGGVHFFRAGDAIDLAEKALPILVARAGRPGIATLLDQGRHNLAHLGNAISRFLVRIAHGGA
jgi:glycosyltransferase involved in cell wall biosynthesis